jgi:hypothetical protein
VQLTVLGSDVSSVRLVWPHCPHRIFKTLFLNAFERIAGLWACVCPHRKPGSSPL